MILSRPYQKARATNSGATSFASKVATITEPSGDGVIQLAHGPNGHVPCHALLLPYGTGDANDVFDFDVWGWRRLGSGTPGNTIWIPSRIAGFTATLGTHTGVAGAPVVATELFADTLTIRATVGEATITADVTREGTHVVYSPADNTSAWAKICLYGFEKIEVIFDMTTGDPTGGNCLIAFLD
jgi:hypothetical protein